MARLTGLLLLAGFSAGVLADSAKIYEQCGGKEWTGATSCDSGLTCFCQNPYYSQCLKTDPGWSSCNAASEGSPASSAAAQPAPSSATGGSYGSGGDQSGSGENSPVSAAAAVPSPSKIKTACTKKPAKPTHQAGGGGEYTPPVQAYKPAKPAAPAHSSSPAQPPATPEHPSSPAQQSPPAVAKPAPAQSSAAAAAPAQPATGAGSAPNYYTGGTCNAYTGSKTGMASTTKYSSGGGTACGCGSFASTNKVYSAAGSQNLFGGSGSYCGSGCGTCYELTNVGALPAANMGDCTGAGETITVQITDLCPANGNAQWCSVPDQYGFGAHFDINGGPGWNNPIVQYKQVTCPGSLTSDYGSCKCSKGGYSRARRGVVGVPFPDWFSGKE